MTITVEAIYRNGALELAQMLPFRENEKVQVTIESRATADQQVAAMVRCDDPALIEWAATSPDLDFPEPRESP